MFGTEVVVAFVWRFLLENFQNGKTNWLEPEHVSSENEDHLQMMDFLKSPCYLDPPTMGSWNSKTRRGILSNFCAIFFDIIFVLFYFLISFLCYFILM